MTFVTRRLNRSLFPALAVAALLATAAPATPPGKNGQIAFARYAMGRPGGEPTGGVIFLRSAPTVGESAR
jgi:hypothetical protein